MAKTFTAGVNTLPGEFQGEFEAADRQAKLAEMLLKQSQRERPNGAMVGRFYVPDVWGSAADAFLASRARKDLAGAEQKRSDVLSRYQGKENEALTDLVTKATAAPQWGESLDEGQGMQYPDTATPIQQGLSSQFPRVAALAKALQDQRQAAFSLGYKDATPESQAAGLAAGMDPRRLVPAGQTWGPPTVTDTGMPRATGGGTVQIYGQVGPRGEYRKISGNEGGQSITVDARADADRTKDERKLLTDQMNDLRVEATKRGLADIPQRTQMALKALEILNSGELNTGTGSGIITALQKAGGLAGFKVDPKASETEVYNAFVKQYLPQLLAGFAPISQYEVQQALTQLPTGDMSPLAAKRVLTQIIENAHRSMGDYNRRVELTGQGMGKLGMSTAQEAMLGNMFPFDRYTRPGGGESELIMDALKRLRESPQNVPAPYVQEPGPKRNVRKW